jgi:DNA polymerase III epsilon subunit family exonuclease
MGHAAGDLSSSLPVPSERQRQAIEAPLGPLLVLAGPGAGKTFCLIERIRHLIDAEGFDPRRICAVTFTNKAAGEIAERLEASLGERGHGIKGGTLHALCAELLREHGEWIGARRGFGIADDEYQREVLRRLGVAPRRHGALLVAFGRHRACNSPLTPDDLGIFARYRAYLEHRNLLDFDDLVLRTDQLLTGFEEILEAVARRWDYLLVDEFQDLNPRQYAVIRRLAQRHRNLFAVGDDEQSVFSWTGADPSVLKTFANDFGIREHIVLDRNRRNSRQIFERARRLLSPNPVLFEKQLHAERDSEHAVLVRGFDDEHAEARWLLEDLRADRAASGLEWGAYGLLYRRHEIGDALEASLVSAGIPCRLAAGRALQDDRVVRYLVDALRVIADPADPLRQEAFVRGVLPHPLWAALTSEAERRKLEPLVWMRRVARKLPRDDEDAKKIRRADCALQNLAALARQRTALRPLVEDLLSQRVGTYRTFLEDRHEQLSDPAADPAIVALADRLRPALHGRARVWLPRLGGLEIALSGLLLRAGITSVAFLDGADPPAGAITIRGDDGGHSRLALGLFKALQLVHAGALSETFETFVAVDIETTDLAAGQCEIVELGAARVRSGRIVDRYSQLVRPKRPVAPEAAAVHGIADEMLSDAPSLPEAWPGFRAFLGEDVVVAHNGNGFDFKVLRRLGAELEGGAEFTGFDSLLLARDLHPGSRKLGDLAHAFGIPAGRAHRACDDACTLAEVFGRLQAEKLVRARKTALAHLLDFLGLALALSDPADIPPEAHESGLLKVSFAYALGRYSDCLEHYRLERSAPTAFDAPTLDQVIARLGGRRKLERVRQARRAEDRYPAAMARLSRLLDAAAGAGDTLAEQLQAFLDRVALSRSDGTEQDPDQAQRVNLLTLHSTKGLEFSRVYIVGVEDAQLLTMGHDGRVEELELQEARRLLYVGMTRAKDRLILTRAERRRELPTGGSRFLEEMELVAPAG